MSPTPVPREEVEQVMNLVAGRWQLSQSSRFGNVYNPSTGSVIAKVPMSTAADVDRAVQAAAAALPAWAETPVIDRARVMFRFRDALLRNAEELAYSITLEHGKTLAEARASVQRGVEMLEFACGIPSLIMGQTLPNIAGQVDCETVRHPVGVCVGITPFNFPAMVPLWMFPIALTCGNSFVLKPSEKVPLTSLKLGELLMQAGLPAGVFSIVHGDHECVDALLSHPLVRAVSFVGSTAVARHVYEMGSRHGKRVQAAGGAKNYQIIMPDADLEQAVLAVQGAAYGCAGERCMAGSVAVPIGNIGDRFVEVLCDHANRLRVGPTDQGADVDMGPVITHEHLQRVSRYLDIGRNEGATIALDGRTHPDLADSSVSDLEGKGFLIGPSVLDRVEPAMRVASEEIFGPVLSVVRVADLDQALALGKNCLYGNGASIFTRSGWAARQFKHHFNAGMIGINVGVPAPMAWFPFTGWNQSFFGDLHIQGTEAISFYTQQKVTMARWFTSPQESCQDPVWRSPTR